MTELASKSLAPALEPTLIITGHVATKGAWDLHRPTHRLGWKTGLVVGIGIQRVANVGSSERPAFPGDESYTQDGVCGRVGDRCGCSTNPRLTLTP